MAAAKPRTLLFGLNSGETLGRQGYAQVLNLMKIAGQAYALKTGQAVLVKPYTEKDSLENAIKRKEPDLLINDYGIAINEGYLPLVTLGFFQEATPRECVYVRKSSPYKSVKDLRAQPFGHQNWASQRFVRLGMLIHNDPLRFFRPLKSGKNDESLAIMMSLNQVEGALMQVWIVELMRLTNPGIVQGLRRLECTKVCPQYLSVSPKVTAPEKAALQNFLINIKQQQGMKKYLALLNRLGMIIHPYSKQEQRACDLQAVQHQQAFLKAMAYPAKMDPWFEYFQSPVLQD